MIDEQPLGKERYLLVVGFGDLGYRVGSLLPADSWAIGACSRHPDPTEGFEPFTADYSTPGSLDFLQRLRPDFVLATFSPTSRDVEGYQRGFAQSADNLLNGLGDHRPKRLVMASSTRVYAEASGAWVDESSELSNSDECALAMIEAEQRILASDQSATIVRFGGIYGAPNSRLLSRISGGDITAPEPLRYTNRIHRDDCAGFLAHLIEMARRGLELSPVYNGVDDNPAPAHEVENWLATTMNCTARPGTSAPVNKPAGHKRCSNALLHSTGYALRHPDYRSGYLQLLEN